MKHTEQMKYAKQNRNRASVSSDFYFRVGYVTVSAVKLVFFTAIGLIGFKWLGNLLEMVSEHISVGTGLLAIFIMAFFFIYLDTRNSSDKAKQDTTEVSLAHQNKSEHVCQKRRRAA